MTRDDPGNECERCSAIVTGMTCDCEWDCAFPGECLMGFAAHMWSECHTVEMLEQYMSESEDTP